MQINNIVHQATHLRQSLSRLMTLPESDRLILSPGTLVGLRLLFASLGVRRLALTSEEYYSPDHFPGLEVRVFSPASMPDDILAFDPQAAIVSVVSWKGRVLGTQLLSELRARVQYLVADCTHIGAVGFPSLSDIPADLICGDSGKWMAPVNWTERIAFLRPTTAEMLKQCHTTFSGLFLALDERPRSSMVEAQWVSPSSLGLYADRLEHITRAELLENHRANLRFAHSLVERFAGAQNDRNCAIVYLPYNSGFDPHTYRILNCHLAWHVDGGVRIVCRADEYERHMNRTPEEAAVLGQ